MRTTVLALLFLPVVMPPAFAACPATTTCTIGQTWPQAEEWSTDEPPKLLREESEITQYKCTTGKITSEYYIYHYSNRTRPPTYRAVQPPDWGRFIGGHDHNSFAEATDAAYNECPR